ncbi:hypothetical protein MMC06_006728 [Schaereria dolodes]|nr:hypothetical protein [Schaereria dolodes]
MANVPVSPGLNQTRSQPYIPKLSYRNAIPNAPVHSSGDSICTVSTFTTTQTISTVSEVSTSHKSPGLPPDTLGLPIPPTLASPELNSKNSKKRGSSLFGFLSVKEPSTQAWLDYQQNLSKRSSGKNGRIMAVGMPMVSSAKLPSNVPKVNSRWDGVPQPIRTRGRDKQLIYRQTDVNGDRPFGTALSGGSDRSRSSSRSLSRTRHNRSSTFSTSTAVTSSGSDLKLSEEIKNISIANMGKDLATLSTPSLNSQSTSSLPYSTSVLPPDVLGPPKVSEIYRNESQMSLHLPPPPSYSASPVLTPAEPSPMTPPSLSPFIKLTLPPTDGDIYATDIQAEVMTLPQSEQVTIRSAGSNILAPPITARRKQKSNPFLAGEAQEVQISPEDDHPPLIPNHETRPRKIHNAGQRPLSSYFPTVNQDLGARSQDVKKKLPLGVNLKNRLVAPAQIPNSYNEDGSARALTPTPPGNRSVLRRPKLNLFSKQSE